ncbi:hypothetical protein T481_08545, partial [Enterococcus faecalis PF3]
TDGQNAAVDLTINIAVAIPVIQTFFNGHPQGVSKAMKFTVVHFLILFFVMPAV